MFVTRDGRDQALEVLRELGWQTQIAFPHWLGKAPKGDDFVDVIHSAGNGVARSTTSGSRTRPSGEVLGVRRAAVPGRGDDLVEGVHHGARALRRRGRRAPAAARGRRARLGAPAAPLRRQHWRVLLSPPDAVRLHLPGPSATGCPTSRHGRARSRGCVASSGSCRRASSCARARCCRAQQYLHRHRALGLRRRAHRLATCAMTEEDIAQWTDAIADDSGRTAACAERDGADRGGRRPALQRRTRAGRLQAIFAAGGGEQADVLLLCGDLTDYGLPEEAKILVRELKHRVAHPGAGGARQPRLRVGEGEELVRMLDRRAASTCWTARPARCTASASPA